MTNPKTQKLVNRINRGYASAVGSKRNPEIKDMVKAKFYDVADTFDILTPGGRISAAKISKLDETIQFEIINQLRPFYARDGAIKQFLNMREKVIWLQNKLDRNLDSQQTDEFWKRFHQLEKAGNPYEEGDNTLFIIADEIAFKYGFTEKETEDFLGYYSRLDDSEKTILEELPKYMNRGRK